jgi:uncharacterized protein YbcV (DUF1398 family)
VQSEDGLAVETRKHVFTVERINDLHARVGSAKTFPEYVRGLKALGVERSDSYLCDRHTEYFGQGGHKVVSPAMHELLRVAQTSQRETFLEHLRRHERRQTNYLEMSRGLAESGLEKSTVDTGRMTMTFYDKAGREMLVEPIS